MIRWPSILLCLHLFGIALPALAQSSVQTSGTLVVIPAEGQVTQANDEVHVTFQLEEQDKDKATAASRVNAKMKQGADIIKREDAQAKLKSYGYYTYPVYPEEQGRQTSQTSQPKRPIGWRVGQYLEVRTGNLPALPKTVAAAQQLLSLNGLQFGLSAATARKLDEQRIDAAYRNLNERITAIAKAMGRRPADAIMESVDFEGSGAYAQQMDAQSPKMTMRAAAVNQTPIEEPSFEPGETTLQMRIVGKVRFK